MSLNKETQLNQNKAERINYYKAKIDDSWQNSKCRLCEMGELKQMRQIGTKGKRLDTTVWER